MPENQGLPHLKFDGFFQSKTYNYPKKISIDFPQVQRDRAAHGNALLQQLNNVRERFEIARDEPLPLNIVRDEAIYVEFISEFNFSLKFESLTQERDNPQYQILNIKEEKLTNEQNAPVRFRVVVMMKQGGISAFINKVTQYLNETTKDRLGNLTDTPKNSALINNIASIQLASLESFWSDAPEIPFPSLDELVWWEIWFRKTNNDGVRLENVFHNLREIGADISPQTLEFPEHRVRLVRATARQLSSSLLLLDNLAELRKPQQINDFITSRNVDFREKQDWLQDLVDRTDANISDDSVIVCLLDSGVNNQHPLLATFLPNDRLHTYKAPWGTNDSWPGGGHGTGMGGLAIYGDLVNVMATRNRVRIYHGLESFKIIFPNDPNDPAFYGSLTEYACSTPYVTHPNNRRIFCLAITDSNRSFFGRPSSWSSAIDKIALGNIYNPLLPHLFIVSGGNVDYITSAAAIADYPTKNLRESIHDPGQAYNALTIGSYTRMDRIDQSIWQGVTALAPNGGMSPSNSTSLIWDSQWPNKPDLVFEGGNLAIDSTQLRDDVHSLKPLSLDKEFNKYIFMPFGDTSGAAALVGKMAAELMHLYPDLWPETIRGLLVHSAEWTDRMLNGISFNTATVAAKRVLLRTFGYGVPILENALHSAGNALTMIAENIIQPYRLEGSVKYNEYHLYEIPWPVDILRNELAENDVKLKVTLSYFIDPNPGNRRYATNFHYHSHSLDFKVIKPTEDLASFRRRISAAVEGDENPEYIGNDEPWSLKESLRNKGSVKKDFIITSGADLATRNILAIYPKSGWYKTRKKLNKHNTQVRYSLIVSIETENVDVNIYNPVITQIGSAISITV
jgi:hypothetical protein